MLNYIFLLLSHARASCEKMMQAVSRQLCWVWRLDGDLIAGILNGFADFVSNNWRFLLPVTAPAAMGKIINA